MARARVGSSDEGAVDLRDFGWNEDLEAAQRADPGRDLAPGRVVVEHRSQYRVRTERDEVTAQIAGKLRHDAGARAELPAVGDWVLIERARSGGRAIIQRVLPRQSTFSRKVAGDATKEQVVAANVDVVWLTCALDRDVNLRGLERYLTLAGESGAAPVVVLTKADLCAQLDDVVERVAAAVYGVPVHPVSVVSGAGLASLAPYLVRGRTIALLGPSGAGKSSLINRLLGQAILKVAQVRATDRKGRHTTTHRQLVRLPEGGLVIDTPGMRGLQLWDSDAGIGEAFAEIEALAEGCRFRDCRHTGEPGCAVEVALERGAVDAERVESYRKLQRELAYLDRKQDAMTRVAETRRIKTIMKSVRHHPKRD